MTLRYVFVTEKTVLSAPRSFTIFSEKNMPVRKNRTEKKAVK